MASSSYFFLVLLIVGLMQSASEVSGQPQIGDTIGSECYPPSPFFTSPCLIPNSACTNDGFGTWQCVCKPGMEPNATFTKCIDDATIPLTATECEGNEDCTGLGPGTVCRVNRIISNAVPGNPRPFASSTGKRCQCADDKAVDPKAPNSCTELLTGSAGVVGCQGRGGNSFCKGRNPDYICNLLGPDMGKCTCPPSTPVNKAGACANPNLITCAINLDCTSLTWDTLTTEKATARCDTKLKRCICLMNKLTPTGTGQLEIPAGTPGSPLYTVAVAAIPAVPASPAVAATPAVPASPAFPAIPAYGTHLAVAAIPAVLASPAVAAIPAVQGSPAVAAIPAAYKCAVNKGQSVCSSEGNCATQLGHFCWKASPTTATASGLCMCPPLERFGFGGLKCNEAYGRCCNSTWPANSYQCGLPITPTPGVSNLACLQNSQTCGCPVGFYNPGTGCTSTPPVSVQSVCDARYPNY